MPQMANINWILIYMFFVIIMVLLFFNMDMKNINMENPSNKGKLMNMKNKWLW